MIAVLGGFIGQLYMKAQLSVKREMSNAKAPLIGIFNGAMSGLVSIRAYGAQDMFRKESRVRIDRYVRSARAFYNLNRWVRPFSIYNLIRLVDSLQITTRIDVISSLFTASLATYLLYGPNEVNPSNIGFSLK